MKTLISHYQAIFTNPTDYHPAVYQCLITIGRCHPDRCAYKIPVEYPHIQGAIKNSNQNILRKDKLLLCTKIGNDQNATHRHIKGSSGKDEDVGVDVEAIYANIKRSSDKTEILASKCIATTI